MTGHEDPDTLTIAAPVIDLLDGTPAGQDRTVGVHLVEQFPDRSGRPREIPEPFMQPVEAVASRIVGFVVRPRDVPIERHRHVKD